MGKQEDSKKLSSSLFILNNKMKKIFSSFLFLLIISLVMSGCSSQGKYDTFAQCLTENEAVMYGTDWCSYCQNQKSLFGNSFNNIAYVNCV